MKKSLVIAVILALILIMPLVLGQTFNKTDSTNSDKNITEGQGESSNLNALFSQELNLPEKIEPLIKNLLGIQEETLDLQRLIIVIFLLLIILGIAYNIAKLTNSFSKGTAWIGAIAIIVLFSLSGLANKTTSLLLNFVSSFDPIKENLPIQLIVILIGLVVIFYILNLIIGIITESIVKQRSISQGMKVGTQLAKLQAMAEFEKTLGQ